MSQYEEKTIRETTKFLAKTTKYCISDVTSFKQISNTLFFTYLIISLQVCL